MVGVLVCLVFVATVASSSRETVYRLETDVSITVTVDGVDRRVEVAFDEAAEDAARAFCGRHGLGASCVDTVAHAIEARRGKRLGR